MTRKLTDALKAELIGNLPDNTVGEISPADVRAALVDILDSLRPSYGALIGSPAEPVAITLTQTWQPIPLTVWTAKIESDPNEIGADQANGELVIKFDRYNPRFQAEVSFTADNAEETLWTFAVDGIPVGITMSMDGHGATKFTQVLWESFQWPAVNARVSILAKSATASNAVTIKTAQFVGELFTTRYQ